MRTGHGAWGALVACALAAAPAAAQRQERLGVVDFQRLHNEFYQTRRANEELDRRREANRAELADLQARIAAVQEQARKAQETALDSTLPVEQREPKRAEAEQKALELLRLRNDLNERRQMQDKQLDDQARRMRDRLVEQIRLAVADYAEKTGYVVVLDRNSCVYAYPGTDLTKPVLLALNAQKPADQPAAAGEKAASETNAPAAGEKAAAEETRQTP